MDVPLVFSGAIRRPRVKMAAWARFNVSRTRETSEWPTANSPLTNYCNYGRRIFNLLPTP